MRDSGPKLHPDALRYLGLTRARQGDYETGRKEVLLGLKGLYDWLDYIAYNTSTGVYWDATGQIRAELQATQGGVQAANRIWIHCLPVSKLSAPALSTKLFTEQR